MQIKNERGQTVTMLKINGAELKANARVTMPKSVEKESVRPQVDNSFNNRRTIDAVTNMTEMRNVSVENIQTAIYEMNQAQEILNEDSHNPQAIMQFERASAVLSGERANFTGTQEQFQNVVKNINLVQITQNVNYSTLAKNSQMPFSAEDNKQIKEYTELSRKLNKTNEKLDPAKRDEIKEKMAKIETKMESKHNINLKSRQVRKQIAKAESKAGNIKKNMKELKKV